MNKKMELDKDIIKDLEEVKKMESHLKDNKEVIKFLLDFYFIEMSIRNLYSVKDFKK